MAVVSTTDRAVVGTRRSAVGPGDKNGWWRGCLVNNDFCQMNAW